MHDAALGEDGWGPKLMGCFVGDDMGTAGAGGGGALFCTFG